MVLKTSLTALLFGAGIAHGQSLSDEVAGAVELTLIPGWRGADGVHVAGLHFQLAPGWKTYWRSPGDGGLPTRMDWRASDNLEDITVHWPRPQVFRAYGMRSIGYEDEFILPLSVIPEHIGDVSLDAEIDFGICKEICVPVHFNVRAMLSGDQETPTGSIEAALAAQPVPGSQVGVHSVDCVVSHHDDGYVLRAAMALPDLEGLDAVVIESADPTVWIGEPAVEIGTSRLQAVAFMSDQVDPDDVTITLLARDAASEITGCN